MKSAASSKDYSTRGSSINPSNRFLKQEIGDDFDDITDFEARKKRTKFITIYPKTIVNKVKSPDLGMTYSMNPYQGCEHGCTYCYARPTHEYWGYRSGTDFEEIVLVKKNAVALLEQTLQKKSWKVAPIVLSGNTDCYQPCEREFKLTRELLKVMLKYKHPVSIITKNALILRDIDLLKKLAELHLVRVQLSITSLNEDLRRRLEPRTATVKKKLDVLQQLSEAGIPVAVFFSPVIPGLNDHELFAVAKAAKKHGAIKFHYQLVRLNGSTAVVFTDWLEKNYPDRMDKVLHLLRDLRGGALNDSRFGTRMKGEGNYAEFLQQQKQVATNRYFKEQIQIELRCDLFQVPSNHNQLSLF